MPAADRIVRRIPSTRISETKFQISVVTLSIQFYMRRIVTGRSGSIWRIAARIKGMGRCSRGSKWMARTFSAALAASDREYGVARDVWSKHIPVDKGEDAGVEPDGSGEGRDDDERNNRVAADEAETVPEVIPQTIEKSPVVDGFGDFAGQRFRNGGARSREMEGEFCFRAGGARSYERFPNERECCLFLWAANPDF
jgi:hypothetical protein